MRKERLLTPGPVEIPPAVLLEMARPIYHHRTKRFRSVMQKVSNGLKEVFATRNDVLVLASSGTGAMEAAVVNFVSRGEKAIVVQGGKFGKRFGELCEAHGAKVVALDVAPGHSVEPEAVGAALEKHQDVAAVYTTLCETSTGALTDIKAIGEIVSQSDALLIVDGISSIGAVEMRTDDWYVDVLVVGSQKALMVPPGLSFIAVSEKAWEKEAQTRTPRYYFDLRKARGKVEEFDTPFTPALTLVCALEKSLEMILEEGMEHVWARHARLAEAMRAAVMAMGLEVFPKHPANCVTAFAVPETVDAAELIERLIEDFGIRIAGGQEALKGRICRVSHMGYVDEADVLMAASALELELHRMGYSVSLGSAARAAEGVFGGAE